jgi:hypothetical protein
VCDDDAQPRDLDEVLRLATALAEQLLADEIAARSMSPARAKALIGAAQFLHENDVPWPAAVQEVLDKIREQMAAAKLKPNGEDDEG